ncbi:hypothetical protein [Streptomyces sp. Tu 3180]|uniref:hypothetical protein n=1 Tax=Streptomyces sp. Tu 3180 TaxID=2682611 RepID=UPI001FB7ACE1|nr:hypothetical protein [Streptomyces sp. Tu 3180]
MIPWGSPARGWYLRLDPVRRTLWPTLRGGTPWEGVQRRAVAAPPGADRAAVTRGGHGEVHLADARSGREAARLRPAAGPGHGGHIVPRSRSDGAGGDPVGR